MPDILIRDACARDAGPLKACIEAAYAEWGAKIADLPSVADGVGTEIARNLVFVAEQRGDILGGLVLVPHPETMQLANVAVHPDARGTGLGGRLMAHADKVAAGLGKSSLLLTTHILMTGNVALYAHLGWQETDRTGNKIRMEKRLSL